MVDLTTMTVENVPENIESITLVGPPVTAITAAPTGAGVTIKPSTNDEKSLQLSLFAFMVVTFLFV